MSLPLPRENAPAVDVTRLTTDEWPVWRALRLAALAESPHAFGSTLAEWSGPSDKEPRWRSTFPVDGANFVAQIAGAPVGLVRVSSEPSARVVELLSMWVAPDARGFGVGDALIEASFQWVAQNHNGWALHLNVRASNSAAIRLYERHGFATIGPDPDDSSEIVMRAKSDGIRPVSH